MSLVMVETKISFLTIFYKVYMSLTILNRDIRKVYKGALRLFSYAKSYVANSLRTNGESVCKPDLASHVDMSTKGKISLEIWLQ